MNKIYKGQFKDINDTLYTVQIGENMRLEPAIPVPFSFESAEEIGNNAGGGSSDAPWTGATTAVTPTLDSTPITLGATPFTVAYEGDEENIFKPLKLSSATISIVNDDYLFDIYTPVAQGNKVQLLQGSNVIWTGYVTPNLYSQPYEDDADAFEVECIDALSTLQWYNYETDVKKIESIYNIIKKCLKQCNAYNIFYFTCNKQLTSTDTGEVLKRLYISEQNFFDDDNEGWKYKDVLEELCKYLGVTCMAYGNKVYFIDYTALEAGNNDYFMYNINTDAVSKVTLEDTIAVNNSIYEKNGSTLSLDKTFNTVSVETDFNVVDEVIPNIFDDKYIIPWDNNNWQGGHAGNDDANKVYGSKYFEFYWKFYRHKLYTQKWYDSATHNEIGQPFSINMGQCTNTKEFQFANSTLANKIGSVIVKHTCEGFGDFYDARDNKNASPNFKNYLLIFTNDRSIWTPQVLFETRFEDATPFFIGDNTYFLINGSMTCMDRQYCFILPPTYGEKDDKIEHYPAINCSLQVGNYSWNGTQWVEYDGTDKIFEVISNAKLYDKGFNGKEFSVKNNVDWTQNYLDGDSGYAIPAPLNVSKNTAIIFKLWSPQIKPNGKYRLDCLWLKDLSLKVAVAHPYDFNQYDPVTGENVDDTNTVYKNVIDDNYVEEGVEETFKICTWNNKKPNYSSVVVGSGDTFNYLHNVYNPSTQQNLLHEEHFIYNMVSQYKNPAVRVNSTLSNIFKPWTVATDTCLPNMKFIVDSQEIDYRMNSTNINLVEKKPKID